MMGENDKFFCLDLNTYTWEVVKPKKGETPPSRDEHTAVINEADQTMIMFGGFAKGQRMNDTLIYSYQNNEWTKVEVDGPVPQERCGHSAVVHGGAMWIFGGKDDDNQKLNDLWKFNLTARTWQRVEQPSYTVPLPRSGHAADIYGDYMILHGGIFEITKELNDCHLYDFAKNKWITLFEETQSPKKGASDIMMDQSSPISNNLSPKRQGSPKRTSKSPYNKTMNKSKSPQKKALNISVNQG